MPSRAVRELHDAFCELIEKAERSGGPTSRGRSPREICAELRELDMISSEDERRLIQCLDECIYARFGSDQQCRDGIGLCRVIQDRLRAPLQSTTAHTNDEATTPDRFRALTLLVEFARGHARVIALFILVAAMLSGVTWARIPSGGSARVPTLTGTRMAFNFASERSAIDEVWNVGGWATPEAQPTIIDVDVPDTSTTDQDRSLSSDSFDLDTGTDIAFVHAIDPFHPPLYWTHRRAVFDSISPSFGFALSAPQDWSVKRTSSATHPNAELIHRRLVYPVQLAAGIPLELPTPSPAAIPIIEPENAPHLSFTHDDNDVLWVKSEIDQYVTIICTFVDTAAYRQSGIPGTPLTRIPRPLPPNVQRDALFVLDHIGMPERGTWESVIRRLHAYCAGFVVAPITSDERRSSNFLTVALARKGVCRHRARTFFVIANAAGIPTRLVENRLHSFCEVQLPSGQWRRLEFRLENTDDEIQHHVSDQTFAIGIDNPVTDLIFPVSLIVFLIGLVAASRSSDVGFNQRLRYGSLPQDRHRRNPAVEDHPEDHADQIAAHIISELSVHLGTDPDNIDALRAAIARTTMPEPVRHDCRRIINWTRARRSSHARVAAAELDTHYWSCLNILRWLRRQTHA